MLLSRNEAQTVNHKGTELTNFERGQMNGVQTRRIGWLTFIKSNLDKNRIFITQINVTKLLIQ
jgi:hypothetical protein